MVIRSVLITGATGKQGGSVVNALLRGNAPYEILALTRDLQSSSAKKLLQKSPNIKLATGNLEDQKPQCIATSDIGFFAAQGLLKADDPMYKNKSMSLAGKALAFEEFKKTFERKTGQSLPMTYRFLAGMFCWVSKELGYMFDWFRDVGFGACIEECKRVNPGMKSFETWFEMESSWKKR